MSEPEFLELNKFIVMLYKTFGPFKECFKNLKTWNRENKVLNLFNSGHSIAFIARRSRINFEQANEYLVRAQLIKTTKCFGTQTRNEEILRQYEIGRTLESIGAEYSLTRERVRQIIWRTIFWDFAWLYDINPVPKKNYKILKRLTEYRLSQIKNDGKKSRLRDYAEHVDHLIEAAVANNVRAEDFISLSKYTKYSGINGADLIRYRPDIIETIANSRRKRWSTHYTKCRLCGTVNIKHHSLGYCEACYPNSKEYNEMRSNSYNDLLERAFGGNREAAINNSSGQCEICGLTRSENTEKYGRDLFVRHIDHDKNNNNFENLQVLCEGCFQKIPKR